MANSKEAQAGEEIEMLETNTTSIDIVQAAANDTTTPASNDTSTPSSLSSEPTNPKL
jgi:hypothetical protein